MMPVRLVTACTRPPASKHGTSVNTGCSLWVQALASLRVRGGGERHY